MSKEQTDPSADSTSGLSRRALLLAAASLVAAGCGSRSSFDPMASVAMRPANGGTNRAPTPDTTPAPAPALPAKPETITGNGYVVVKRSAWTSQAIKGNNNPMGAVTRITVHHTGEHGNWADLPDVEIVRSAAHDSRPVPNPPASQQSALWLRTTNAALSPTAPDIH